MYNYCHIYYTILYYTRCKLDKSTRCREQSRYPADEFNVDEIGARIAICVGIWFRYCRDLILINTHLQNQTAWRLNGIYI